MILLLPTGDSIVGNNRPLGMAKNHQSNPSSKQLGGIISSHDCVLDPSCIL